MRDDPFDTDENREFLAYVDELERERDAWREAHERAVAMAKVLGEALVEAMEAEGIWYGTPEVINGILGDLGIEPYPYSFGELP